MLAAICMRLNLGEGTGKVPEWTMEALINA